MCYLGSNLVKIIGVKYFVLIIIVHKVVIYGIFIVMSFMSKQFEEYEQIEQIQNSPMQRY